MSQQFEELMVSDVATAITGGDPMTDPPSSRAMGAHSEVSLAHYLVQKREWWEKRQDVLDSAGWDQIKAYREEVLSAFRQKNREVASLDPEEQRLQSLPVELEPNQLADMRGMTAKIHNALRANGFEGGVWNDPELAKIAHVFSQDVTTRGYGYVQSGEQEYRPAWKDAPIGFKQLGWLGTEAVGPAVAAVAETGFNFGYGIMELGTRAFEGMTGMDVNHTMPNVVLQDDNGRVVHNGGKLPSGTELIGAMVAAATGEDIAATMREVGLSEQYANLRRSGVDAVVAPISSFVGSIAGFVQPGGWAMAGGQALFKNGLVRLAGAERLAAMGPWARKLTSTLANTGGAAFGNGMFMGTTYGHHEGFAEAFIEGASITPVILALGAMGRGLERGILQRAKMPRVAARAVSGAMEGAGFGLYSLATEGEAFHGAQELWNFIRDPDAETWDRWSRVMFENVVGMMVFKSTFGVTPGQYALDRMSKLPEAATKERSADVEFQRELTADARQEFAARGRALRAEGEAEVARKPVEAPSAERVPESVPEPTTAPEAPLKEGRKLAFEEVGPDRQEWKVRDAEGRLVAGGSITVEGGKAQIWSAEVRPEMRGKGIYPEVLRELARRFPEGLESVDQTPEAQQAWKKAFGGVSRGTVRELGERLAQAEAGLPQPEEEARLRTRARTEAAGRYAEPEAVRERLYERVSARGEFPATGREVTAEGRPGAEPIHARDVISEAEVGPIAPAVQAGSMGARKRWARGYYDTREDLIRMEGARDLNNLAHEWGHALWGKLGDQMGLDSRARRQLLSVGEPTSTDRMRTDQRLHEGMAEFMARHLLGDRELSTKHPELYEQVMGFLSSPEQAAVGEQLGRMESSFGQWRDQGALNQLRMSWVAADEPMTRQEAQLILGKPIERMTPLTRARANWRKGVVAFEHAMVDDLARVRRAQQRALKAAGVDPGTVPITANPIRMMQAVRGKSGAVLETFLFRHALGFAGVGGRRGPSLRESLQEVRPEEREAFTSYLVARRSLEALDKGMPAQLPREHYLLGIERLGNPRFERAAQELKGWFDNLVNYSVEAGALTTEAGNAIRDSWTVYVPFFRALSGPAQVQPGRGVAERGSGLQRMKGAELEIRDPLEAALEVGQSIIQKAHQAAAMKAFYNLHLTTEGMGRFVTEVPRDVRAREVTFDDLAAALERLEFPGDIQHISETFAGALRGLSVEDAQAVLTMFTQETRPKGSKPIVAFVPRYTPAEIARFEGMPATKKGFADLAEQVSAENGKLKWLRLDNDAYTAVMDIDPSHQMQHPILRALTVPSYAVKFGATAVNPAFMIRNIARDTLLNAMFTDVQSARRMVPVLGAVTNFVEGLSQQLRHDKGAELFRDIGGMQATFIGREFGMPSRQIMNPKSPAEAYRKMVTGLAAPEATLRIREFIGIRDRALEQGKSELDANLEALEAGQEISVNFIRAGVVSRSINQFVPYWNAGIQGNRKFLRHVLGYEGKDKQKQAIGQGLSNITIPSFMFWMLYKDEDWYRDLPHWRRNNYWTFQVPFSDELVSVPKPFEAGKIFGNIPEYLMNLHHGKEVPLSELGHDVAANFFNGFDWMPAFMGPSIESITNYSFWKGREIVPDWMEEGRLPEDQYTSYTTQTAKLLGRWFNFSPAKVEHWLSGHTGGMALSAMRAVDSLTGEGPAAADPGIDPEDMPFVGSFFRQRPHRQGQTVQDLYDLHRQLSQMAGSDQITPAQNAMRPAVRRVKERISGVKKMVREGRLSADEGNRRAFELAQPVLEAYERRVR